jgi:hypothetical protein
MSAVKAIDVLEVCAALAALPGLRYLNVVHGRELALTLHGPQELAQHEHELHALRGGTVFLFFVLMVPDGHRSTDFVDQVKDRLPAVPGGWSAAPATLPAPGPPSFVQFLGTLEL